MGNDLEHHLHTSCMAYCEMQGMLWTELNAIYAIPNQGKRSYQTGGRFKSEGLKKGMPDVHLPVARRMYHSLYVEFKAPGKKPRKSQLDKMDMLYSHNNLVYTIDNYYDFVELVTWYLGHEEYQWPYLPPTRESKYSLVRADGNIR